MLKSNVVQSLFWLGILVYMIWCIKKSYIRFNKNQKSIIGITIISAFYIIIYFYTGFIFGFVKSPFSHELVTSLKNILMTIIPIVGIQDKLMLSLQIHVRCLLQIIYNIG